MEAVTEIRENPFFGTGFIHASKEGIFPMETVFFFFYSVLLSCKWKPLLKLVETSMVCKFYIWSFLISRLKKAGPIHESFKSNCQGANMFYAFSAFWV